MTRAAPGGAGGLRSRVGAEAARATGGAGGLRSRVGAEAARDTRAWRRRGANPGCSGRSRGLAIEGWGGGSPGYGGPGACDRGFGRRQPGLHVHGVGEAHACARGRRGAHMCTARARRSPGCAGTTPSPPAARRRGATRGGRRPRSACPGVSPVGAWGRRRAMAAANPGFAGRCRGSAASDGGGKPRGGGLAGATRVTGRRCQGRRTPAA